MTCNFMAFSMSFLETRLRTKWVAVKAVHGVITPIDFHGSCHILQLDSPLPTHSVFPFSLLPSLEHDEEYFGEFKEMTKSDA